MSEENILPIRLNFVNLPKFCKGFAAILAAINSPPSAVLELNFKILPN